MIRISSQLLNQLVEYCRGHLPNEACGAFIGRTEQQQWVIEDFKSIPNVAIHPERHFEMSPPDLLQLIYPIQGSSWIGIFHSHPLTAAYPSHEDLINQWEFPIYAILSFAQINQPVIKSYEILRNQQKKPYSIREQTINMTMNTT